MLTCSEGDILTAMMIGADGVALIWPVHEPGITIGGTAKNVSIRANLQIVDQMIEKELIEGHAPFFMVTDMGRAQWREIQRTGNPPSLWRRLAALLGA